MMVFDLLQTYLPTLQAGQGNIWHIVTGLVLLVTTFIGIRSFFDPLSSLPGPWIAKWTSAYYTYHFFKADTFTTLLSLHRTFKGPVRIAPGIISFDTPTAANTIYNSLHFVKTPAYDAFHVDGPNIFSTQDRHINLSFRRPILSGFTVAHLRSQEDSVQTVAIDELVALVEREIAASPNGIAKMNLDTVFHHLAADVVGDIVFNQKFNMLSSGKEHPFLSWLGSFQRMMGLSVFLPFASVLKKYFFPEGVKAYENIRAFVDDVIQKRLQQPRDEKPTDVVGMLMNATDVRTDKAFDARAIAAQSVVFFVAGSDSTSNTMSLLFQALLSNADVLEQLTAEVRNVFLADSRIPMSTIGWSTTPMLWATVQETFRVYPVIANGLPRWSMQDTVVDGVHVPARTVCVVSQYAMHRNKTLFGEDADKYRPRRWLEMSTEERNSLSSMVMPFSVGQRMCVARNLVLMELYLTVAVLVTRYNLKLASPVPCQLTQQAFNAVSETDQVWVYLSKP